MKKITSVKKLAKGGRQGTKESSGKSFSAGPSTSQSKSGFSVSGQGDGQDRNAAAIIQSPSVKQGIAAITGSSPEATQSANPFNFGIMGIARNLIDSLAGGGGGMPNTRPQMRPSIMQVGETDADRRMVATRDMPRFGISAGNTTTAPSYSPFSFRGLTSTDPGNVMRNIMGAERQMRNMPMGSNEGTAPTPVVAPPPPAATTMPAQRPAWWPADLPWPPAPTTAPLQPTYVAPPVAPVVPQYSTSYSGLQSVISGAGNPLMMGIGGMVRRP
jgi:hypothetical protein